jgi:hypothetical protein
VTEQVTVYAEFRNGYWYTSDDSPTARQIVSKNLDGLTHAVSVHMPEVDVKVIPRIPGELTSLAADVESMEKAVGKLEDQLSELRKQARLAELRYEAGYQSLGVAAADAAVILEIDKQTVQNNWTTYKRLMRE